MTWLIPLIVFAFSQVATPGPANMALLSVGAAYGFRKALPFVAGVVVGKQLIIWPLGFGLMELAMAAPWLFVTLKYCAAAYILYLAYRVATMKLKTTDSRAAPGFWAGMIVHPLNPKAWGMITAAFTAFGTAEIATWRVTLTVAAVLMVVQFICHPLWAYAGSALVSRIAGTRWERVTVLTLAALTVLSVLYALFGGSLS